MAGDYPVPGPGDLNRAPERVALKTVFLRRDVSICLARILLSTHPKGLSTPRVENGLADRTMARGNIGLMLATATARLSGFHRDRVNETKGYGEEMAALTFWHLHADSLL
jgi:hypothetical protein